MRFQTKPMVGKFGRLRVVAQVGTHPTRGGAMWRCRCECGNESVVEGRLLRSGTTTSCGCARKGVNRKHGRVGSREYYSWTAMIQRCENPKHMAFGRYGGRGVTICPRWRKSFQAFLEDMGDRSPGMTLDRIDNDGNYEPGNCRWATRLMQGRNRRTNWVIRFRGVSKTLKEWATSIGITHSSLARRIKSGWRMRDALTMPAAKGLKYSLRTNKPPEGTSS